MMYKGCMYTCIYDVFDCTQLTHPPPHSNHYIVYDQMYFRLTDMSCLSGPTRYVFFSCTCMCVPTGLAGLERPEQPTVNSASSLFVSYLALVESAESIRSAVSEKGASLVQYVLQAIAGAAPRSYLTAFSDVLGALSTHCVSLLSQWLEVGLYTIRVNSDIQALIAVHKITGRVMHNYAFIKP